MIDFKNAAVFTERKGDDGKNNMVCAVTVGVRCSIGIWDFAGVNDPTRRLIKSQMAGRVYEDVYGDIHRELEKVYRYALERKNHAGSIIAEKYLSEIADMLISLENQMRKTVMRDDVPGVSDCTEVCDWFRDLDD